MEPRSESVDISPEASMRNAMVNSGADPDNLPTGEPFDPSDHTVEEVQAYLEGNPDDRARVLKLEKSGKVRTTILDS